MTPKHPTPPGGRSEDKELDAAARALPERVRFRRPIICGGRDFTDREYVLDTLTFLHNAGMGFLKIIEGGCPTGVDKFAYDWAALHRVIVDHVPVAKDEWARLGKRAGPLRNQRMIDECKPDGVIAFPGNKGTNDMVSRALYAGLPVYRVALANSAGARAAASHITNNGVGDE